MITPNMVALALCKMSLTLEKDCLKSINTGDGPIAIRDRARAHVRKNVIDTLILDESIMEWMASHLNQQMMAYEDT
mgnify:CR=1 FL=1